MFLNIFGLVCVSLCSLCSIYFREVADYEYKDNIVLKDVVPTKSLYANADYAYVGLSEVGSYTFYEYFMNEIQKGEYIYNSGRTYTDFVNGDYLYCDLTGKNIRFGNIDSYSGEFTLQDLITAIRVDLNRAPTYRDSITYRFYYSSSVYRSVEVNIFYQDTAKTMPCSCSATFFVGASEPSYYDNLCIRYSVSELRGLLPQNFVDIEYNNNYADGYNNGYDTGYNNGKSDGFQDGVQHALDNYNYDATATTIFTGITSIALVPIDMFLRIFNFEILGINVAGLVTGLLTMAVIIIVIRMITGNKND